MVGGEGAQIPWLSAFPDTGLSSWGMPLTRFRPAQEAEELSKWQMLAITGALLAVAASLIARHGLVAP